MLNFLPSRHVYKFTEYICLTECARENEGGEADVYTKQFMKVILTKVSFTVIFFE